MEKSRVLQGVGVVIGYPDPLIVAFENTPPPVPEPEPVCPITAHEIITAMLTGQVRKFTKMDWYGYAGVVGDGYMLERETFHVVIGVAPPELAHLAEGVLTMQVIMERPPSGDEFANPYVWEINPATGAQERIL